MILVRGYCDLSTTYTEAEMRREISETFEQRFPLMTPTFFDFVKRERNIIITPVVKLSHKSDFQQVKELCGQGKLYIRLNVSREALEMTDPIPEENVERPVMNEHQHWHHLVQWPQTQPFQEKVPAIQYLLLVPPLPLKETTLKYNMLSK
jgi:hypothetical protein